MNVKAIPAWQTAIGTTTFALAFALGVIGVATRIDWIRIAAIVIGILGALTVILLELKIPREVHDHAQDPHVLQEDVQPTHVHD